MSTEVKINQILQRWRSGVKSKFRGSADFIALAQTRIKAIKDRIIVARHPLDEWQIKRARYIAPQKYEYLDEDWQTIRVGDKWGGEEGTAFLQKDVVIPDNFAGRKVFLRMHMNGDTLVSINGRPHHALDPFHFEFVIAENAKAGEKFNVELEAYVTYHAEKEHPHDFGMAELAVVDDEINRVYWDAWCVFKMFDIPNLDKKLEAFLSDRMMAALELVPLQDDEPAAVKRGILACGEKLRKEIYNCDRFHVSGMMHLVGHSHIDIVFMWPYKEFIRKIARTHTSMLRLMDQYPQFRFCQSQAKLYADIKQYYPTVYEEIKKRVAEGRWELIGAFWVEPDCNLISGESFVRQILHGQKFFEQEFGFRSRTCWQPDVFGLSWCMPQILARAGIEYFLTNKMMAWNDTNPWQLHTFWWEGADGSRVLSIVPPGHFIGTVDPDIMDRQWNTFNDKETINETLHIYGWGDGGGGPDPEEIESGIRYADFPGLPKTKFSNAEEAFDRIREKAERVKNLPVLRDEIYLEAHRGTYTTKGKLKKLNRKMELLYREAEIAASLADRLKGAAYPVEPLDKGWKDLLTAQFHDSLPGTHINEVYPELLADYEQIESIGDSVRQAGLAALFGRTVTKAAAGNTLTLFNSLMHNRSDWAALPAEMLGDASIADDDEGILPQQPVTDLDGTHRVLVKTPEVPQVGYRAFNVVASGQLAAAESSVSAIGTTLENECLRAQFNSQGDLVSLWDKEYEREVLVEGEIGNHFQMYEDTPGHYEAWDIVASYVDHEIELPQDGRVSVDETGPVRASIMIEKSITANSRIRQRVSLYAGSRQLAFETEIDWVERERLLKVTFPVDINTLHATHDIAYGNMIRANHGNTPFDAAKFEVPTHFWMDMSQSDYGVALLNDCKYGHEADDKRLRLTLLKGPKYPDPESDKEKHYFTYVLYPHTGNWQDAGVNEEALNLNNPVVPIITDDAPEQQQHSFIRCDNVSSMTLEAIKQSEDGRDTIIRLVERQNKNVKGSLTFDQPVKKAWTCNLMEENEKELEVDGHTVYFNARPNKIITLRVR